MCRWLPPPSILTIKSWEITGTAVISGLLKLNILFGLRLIIFLLQSAGFKHVGYQVFFECLIKEWDTISLKRKQNTFVSPSHTHEHMTHRDTLYVFFFKSLKLYTLLCFSLEFHFRNANALGPDTPWFISSFIFPHICLCPCVCLLLIPPLFQPVCLPWDLGLPHLLRSAMSHRCSYARLHTRAYTCIRKMRTFTCSHCCSSLMLPSLSYCLHGLGTK